MNHTSTNKDLMDAIDFALNHPVDFELLNYNMHAMGPWQNIKGVYLVRVMDGGWNMIELDAPFVHSCLKRQGRKRRGHWIAPTKYKDIFI